MTPTPADTFSANTGLTDLSVYSPTVDIPRPSSFIASIRSPYFVNAQFLCVETSHILEWGRTGEFKTLKALLETSTFSSFAMLQLGTAEDIPAEENKKLEDIITHDMGEHADLVRIGP